ncbi:30S ribosomal protein S14 [Candidatus Woesearchaeota archaeon]|jgi:small subunit ribosomal protein S14|nr:30S ribosomal protein S14 [Candidatus Woesearchaeota archaeon]
MLKWRKNKLTYSHFKKPLKQLKVKPPKLKKYLKHNTPKQRKTGKAKKRCRRCLRIGGHIDKYGLNLCRQCFRQIATKIGFKKYN